VPAVHTISAEPVGWESDCPNRPARPTAIYLQSLNRAERTSPSTHKFNTAKRARIGRTEVSFTWSKREIAPGSADRQVRRKKFRQRSGRGRCSLNFSNRKELT